MLIARYFDVFCCVDLGPDLGVLHFGRWATRYSAPAVPPRGARPPDPPRAWTPQPARRIRRRQCRGPPGWEVRCGGADENLPRSFHVKKIPTMFERDWAGDRSRVVDKIHPGCEWVAAGEGNATWKLDGTCCLIRDGKLYKRQEIKGGQTPPPDFEEADFDEETGKRVGWRPVGEGPEDRWHREAFDAMVVVIDGTYELVGPKVQGNPEKFSSHELVPHTYERLGVTWDAPRTFDGLKNWLAAHDVEGLVFHHPDGRMAKIKKRDFGLNRGGGK